MGREEGGGFRMGNTCMPVVDSFGYLAWRILSITLLVCEMSAIVQ